MKDIFWSLNVAWKLPVVCFFASCLSWGTIVGVIERCCPLVFRAGRQDDEGFLSMFLKKEDIYPTFFPVLL